MSFVFLGVGVYVLKGWISFLIGKRPTFPATRFDKMAFIPFGEAIANLKPANQHLAVWLASFLAIVAAMEWFSVCPHRLVLSVLFISAQAFSPYIFSPELWRSLSRSSMPSDQVDQPATGSGARLAVSRRHFLASILLLIFFPWTIFSQETSNLKNTAPLTEFLTDNIDEDGMPLSYKPPKNYWREIDSRPTNVDDTIERLLTTHSLNIYDGAIWQIGLTLTGQAQQASSLTTRLLSGRSGELRQIRAGERFEYGDDRASLTPEEGLFFRIISSTYLQTDPLDGKTELDGFPTNSLLHHEDWKPVIGENAWAAILGPLQIAWLKSGGKIGLNSPEGRLALSLLPALRAMFNERTGGFYYVPFGTAGKNPREIYTENNISLYAALRILREAARQNKKEDLELEISHWMTRQENFFRMFAFNKTAGVFYTGGRVENGQFIPKQEFAVDAQTWTVAALDAEMIDRWFGEGAAYQIWQKTKGRAGYLENGVLRGVGFTDGHADQSSEWTFGAILMAEEMAAYYHASHPEWSEVLQADADSMRQGVEKLRVTLSDGSAAYLYASRRFVIPWGWNANPIPSLAGTAWAIMDARRFNPFIPGGGKRFQSGARLAGQDGESSVKADLERLDGIFLQLKPDFDAFVQAVEQQKKSRLTEAFTHPLASPMSGAIGVIYALKLDPGNLESRSRLIPMMKRGLHAVEVVLNKLSLINPQDTPAAMLETIDHGSFLTGLNFEIVRSGFVQFISEGGFTLAVHEELLKYKASFGPLKAEALEIIARLEVPAGARLATSSVISSKARDLTQEGSLVADAPRDDKSVGARLAGERFKEFFQKEATAEVLEFFGVTSLEEEITSYSVALAKPPFEDTWFKRLVYRHELTFKDRGPIIFYTKEFELKLDVDDRWMIDEKEQELKNEALIAGIVHRIDKGPNVKLVVVAGRPIMVQFKAEGKSLKEISEGEISEKDAQALGEAFGTLRKGGILHGNLLEEHVFLDRSMEGLSTVHLIDFGLGRLVPGNQIQREQRKFEEEKIIAQSFVPTNLRRVFLEAYTKASDTGARLAISEEPLQTFFTGLTLYHDVNAEEVAIRSEDGSTQIFTMETVTQTDGATSLLVYSDDGTELFEVPNLTEAQKTWQTEHKKLESKRHEENTIRSLLKRKTQETLELLPANTSVNTFAYTEIPLDKISEALTSDKEFEAILIFFETWARFRPTQNLYFSGIDPARQKLIQDFLTRLQALNRQAIITSDKPSNALIVKLNFVQEQQITVPVIDPTRGELLVHVDGFQDDNLPNLPRALALAEAVQAVYSPFFRVGANNHSPLLELTEDNLPVILESISTSSTIHSLGVVNPQTWHEVFTGSSQARLIRQVMVPPILQFLNERLKALQLLEQVLSFA